MKNPMDRNTKTDWKYLLAMLGFCAAIPHSVLCLLQMDAFSAVFSPIESENLSNFFVCQWIPFWMALIAYLRLQKTDRFSLLPALCAGVIVLTFLPGYPRKSITTIAFTIPLMLPVEYSALLKAGISSPNKLLAGIAANRELLQAFWFWSLVFPCVVLISCEACTWYRAIVSPFQMLPIPGVLLFDVFRHQKNQPPTIWGFLGMLPTVPLSLFLVTIGPMAQFKFYHLMCLGIGYALLFLMLIVYNLDHWKQQTCK